MIRQKSFENEKATLYVVATPIGNLEEMTPRAIHVLESVDVIAAEDTRNTLKLLNYFGIRTRLIAHHQHNEEQSANGLLELLRQGKNVAVVSDAGYPLISDPGSVVVKKVMEEGFNVVPISGSNAMLNALVASGMNTRHFLFYGFLKAQEKERIRELHELKYYPFTIVFYEAPHRIEKMLKSCLEVLGNRQICLARELTKKHEEFIRGTIEEVLEIVDDIKGEMVVVIEGCSEEKNPGEDQASPLVHEQIKTYIDGGLTTNEAIKRVAKELGLSKNDLYKEYHGLS
ncbi:ribosomal RNA small subunit methyltransferase I [Amedibacterium intestinale]|uniref:Ribosomal RNA small subunit methyltransferase I n=1 Tax=Amedibacterium intestinale TaxID=2583452 RepID=A0A6N4TK86_9FIRM|nr:16S rRNA (cytidine(1402)-2'-O)-methyltransferase [Amedibacterium intestinale]BBK23223.1 ribosomal RNA small subunit methyltransferase I [Amedibacterium intestinale]